MSLIAEKRHVGDTTPLIVSVRIGNTDANVTGHTITWRMNTTDKVAVAQGSGALVEGTTNQITTGDLPAEAVSSAGIFLFLFYIDGNSTPHDEEIAMTIEPNLSEVQ